MPTLNWIGKDKVINHHLDVPFRTLDTHYTFTSNTPNSTETKPATAPDNLIIHNRDEGIIGV